MCAAAGWACKQCSSCFADYEGTKPFDTCRDLPVACLARYSVDQKFYRAELCHRCENSAQYRVQFVDYGNFDLVAWSK